MQKKVPEFLILFQGPHRPSVGTKFRILFQLRGLTQHIWEPSINAIITDILFFFSPKLQCFCISFVFTLYTDLHSARVY